MRLLVLILASALIVPAAIPCEGTILHVPGDYATICEATAVAEFGDTVLVAPGIYEYPSQDCRPIADGVALVSEAGAEQTILNAWMWESGLALIEFEPGAGPQTSLVGFTIYCVDIGGSPVSQAIRCDGASPMVAGNVVLPSPVDPWAVVMVGIECTPESAPRIVNNTLVTGSGSAAIELHGSSATISHNIIAQCDAGIYCSGDSDPVISCNDIWEVPVRYPGACPPAEGDFYEDPLFCDPVTSDYTLNCESPAVHGYGCGLVGALPVGCGASAAHAESWGTIKVMFR